MEQEWDKMPGLGCVGFAQATPAEATSVPVRPPRLPELRPQQVEQFALARIEKARHAARLRFRPPQQGADARYRVRVGLAPARRGKHCRTP